MIYKYVLTIKELKPSQVKNLQSKVLSALIDSSVSSNISVTNTKSSMKKIVEIYALFESDEIIQSDFISKLGKKCGLDVINTALFVANSHSFSVKSYSELCKCTSSLFDGAKDVLPLDYLRSTLNKTLEIEGYANKHVYKFVLDFVNNV